MSINNNNMKYYNASIYFTYKGSTPNITENELESKIALALEDWLNINDTHVELVDETEDEPCVLTSPDKSSMPSSTDSKE